MFLYVYIGTEMDYQILFTKMKLSTLFIYQKFLKPRHLNSHFHKRLILVPKFKLIYVTVPSAHLILELSAQGIVSF